jgi:L-alanine-DL-glutamate epimerase-like enolase superfamily enzyme
VLCQLGGITQAASLHLASTIPNLLNIGHSFRSVLRLTGDCTNFASFIRAGRVSLPAGPGLGIEVNEDSVRRSALESYRVTNPAQP